MAVITGGANGIGFAAGKLFAEEGAHVVLVDLSEESLWKAAEAIGSERVSYVVADVSQPEQAEGCVPTTGDRGRTAALECAAEGIRVNTVNPAPIETRMMRLLEAMRTHGDPEQARRNSAALIPMQRYCTPEEVERLMLFP